MLDAEGPWNAHACLATQAQPLPTHLEESGHVVAGRPAGVRQRRARARVQGLAQRVARVPERGLAIGRQRVAVHALHSAGSRQSRCRRSAEEEGHPGGGTALVILLAKLPHMQVDT